MPRGRSKNAYTCPRCLKVGGPGGMQAHIKFCGREAETFWAKVDRRGPDECWPWRASTFKKKGKQMGYGRHEGSGPYTYAHRCAWIFTNGAIPAGLLVMHQCDNVICCNPAHLQIGTDKQNNDDKLAKGRAPTKLTAEQVLEIRAAFAGIPKGGGQGMNLALAKKYGVSDKTICVIRHGHKWKHLQLSDIQESPR